MDLRRYFQPVRGDALPDPKGPLSATIPRQAIAEANKRVQEAAIAKASKKRGSYGLHSPLPRSRVFTRHCQWSTETLQCLRNSLARDTMSTIYVAAMMRAHIYIAN